MTLVQRTSLAIPLAEYIADFYPEPLRREIKDATPALALHATRLGMEILLAEEQGLRFSQAVLHPDFPLMERVYFGAQATLQHRLTPALRVAVSAMIQHGIDGGFDSVRKVLFAVATRRDDPDAAMCRFLLWVGVRINLLVATWEVPEAQTSGALEAMEDRAEQVLRELLDVPDLIVDSDVRPLQVLVAEMLIRTGGDVREKLTVAIGQYGGELTQIMENAEALAAVRQLDDRHAVLFSPGPFAGQPGSAQLARRYPMQHPSPSALEQARSRFKKRRVAVLADPPDDRFIDVLRGHEGAVR